MKAKIYFKSQKNSFKINKHFIWIITFYLNNFITGGGKNYRIRQTGITVMCPSTGMKWTAVTKANKKYRPEY